MSISFPTVNRDRLDVSRRLKIDDLSDPTVTASANDGSDLIAGLTQKQKSIPCHYLYDDRGSEIFEQICELPEYYPTRTEAQILRENGSAIAQTTGNCELIELGSGSSTKTRLLFDAYQSVGEHLYYIPIDVSAGILEASAKQLLADYPSLDIHGLIGTYQQALQHLPPSPTLKRMVFFLGSSLGNFAPKQCREIFQDVKKALQLGDYFLLGLDLQKSKDILEPAYNDSQGVTAEFNYNLLDHLNRRFQGDFNRQHFRHWTFYNSELGQIETYLRSTKPQTVELKALNLTVEFREGETIHTEISRKFNLQEMEQELAQAGLPMIETWTDSQDWFALVLCQAT
ncbi:methyltransferase [Halothece sp. PCC 7418]|uniref:L-histidine N(alpha)-methyltransferase n=1 Tax=Halothece sp. (strain PCC 7418) TaxID=65093 RepID=UPI0002A06F37|nr:L-histidine N(alpha)-methyltransferase [Halothece sp. PCC 7418]AFZ45856.1 methyltransferase [Halothece sp. PCC 7418]